MRKKRNVSETSKRSKKQQRVLLEQKQKNYRTLWSPYQKKNEYSFFQDKFLNDYLQKRTVRKSLRKLSRVLRSARNQKVKTHEKKTIKTILQQDPLQQQEQYKSRYTLNQSYNIEKNQKKREKDYQRWSFNNVMYNKELKTEHSKNINKEQYLQQLHKKWQKIQKSKQPQLNQKKKFSKKWELS